MRIEDEYVKTGCFWLPERDEKKIPGVLTIKNGGNNELEVVGLFDDSNICNIWGQSKNSYSPPPPTFL